MSPTPEALRGTPEALRGAPDLQATLAEAFALLARGVADRRYAFHTPTLATAGADGFPAARSVVLRGFEAGARRLRLHSDSRAGKVAELASDPRAALHFYDPAAAIQLRLAGRVTLHRADAVAEAAWAGSHDFSRRCYAIEPAPGTPCPAPPPAPTDSAAGWPNFCVLRLQVVRLEWLHLAAAGHRRALFTWPEGQPPAAGWLVP
ncbi:pyridoxamine 5'-phosphate oxidase family protein [Falsiroseomonas tokyonensis]|uniref:Pyridoxamine 5'-phosphate oxidase family protein n=1 Tax=Falsiroseomonas tokyonensis TaxID=430521 RepID=A0ABV7BQW6_9PROT|nr:pyridoxamine 5'-phosphate oxidase family protein [Falsiroseomonas tokyonensis]MBU8537932.1 pyridoxamine 5'-phosphate oxidase family protein [Falsiroseomonas tokyonensis]